MGRLRTGGVVSLFLSVGICLSVASCARRKPEAESGAPEAALSPVAAAPIARSGLRALPVSAFRVEWKSPDPLPSMPAGAATPVAVTVRNSSDQVWPNAQAADPSGSGAGAVRLSYRWKTAAGGLLIGYKERIDLPNSLSPGESATLSVPVVAPSTPGDYKLQFDLVQELVTWFEDKNAAKLIVSVKVR